MNTRNDIDGLTSLPDEVIRTALFYCATYINLPHASSFFWRFFKNEKNKPITIGLRKEVLDLLRRLLSHAALGEWEEAEKIWTLYPSILICRGTIYHPNRIYQADQTPFDIPIEMNPGRYKYVNCTIWQIAMMNEEYDEAESMGKFMTDEEKKTQFKEIFPDGNIRKYNWNSKKAENLLQAVFNEVIKDESIKENDLSQMNAATRNALYALYAYMKPAPVHQIGLVFDTGFYLKARQMYEEKFIHSNTWGQRSFWCMRVEEWLAACLGTGYLRSHAQGMGNTVNRKGCVLANESSYFAFRRELASISGYHFFVGYEGDRARGLFARKGEATDRFCKSYVSKSEQGQNLLGDIQKPRSQRI